MTVVQDSHREIAICGNHDAVLLNGQPDESVYPRVCPQVCVRTCKRAVERGGRAAKGARNIIYVTLDAIDQRAEIGCGQNTPVELTFFVDMSALSRQTRARQIFETGNPKSPGLLQLDLPRTAFFRTTTPDDFE